MYVKLAYVEILDCVVSDLCGPMHDESINGKRYMLTFTDLHSKYTEVAFIKGKDEVHGKLVNYIEQLKTQLNRKPKIFRSDQGLEYHNSQVRNYLEKEGIKIQYSVVYSPQQNGVAERKNRTLIEAARSMLIGSGLQKKLWAEAVYTANYIFNRIPCEGKGESPFEMMFKTKSRIDEYHEFGCDVFVKIPDKKRKKLDDTAAKMKFLGYDESSKGYRVLNDRNRLSIVRDIIFLDTKENWSEDVEDNHVLMEFDGEIEEEETETVIEIQDFRDGMGRNKHAENHKEFGAVERVQEQQILMDEVMKDQDDKTVETQTKELEATEKVFNEDVSLPEEVPVEVDELRRSSRLRNLLGAFAFQTSATEDPKNVQRSL